MPHRVDFLSRMKTPSRKHPPISTSKKIIPDISDAVRPAHPGKSGYISISKMPARNRKFQRLPHVISLTSVFGVFFDFLFVWLPVLSRFGSSTSDTSSSVVDISHSSSYIKYNTEVVKLSSYPCCSHHLCMHWCASRYDSHWSVAAALLPFRHLYNNWLTSPCVVMVATT